MDNEVGDDDDLMELGIFVSENAVERHFEFKNGKNFSATISVSSGFAPTPFCVHGVLLLDFKYLIITEAIALIIE